MVVLFFDKLIFVGPFFAFMNFLLPFVDYVFYVKYVNLKFRGRGISLIIKCHHGRLPRERAVKPEAAPQKLAAVRTRALQYTASQLCQSHGEAGMCQRNVDIDT